MIPFLLGILEDDTPMIMPVVRTADVEALAHNFMERGGRYIVTECTPEYIRIAAVVAGQNDSIHELAAETVQCGSAVEMVDRLIFASIRLMAPVN